MKNKKEISVDLTKTGIREVYSVKEGETVTDAKFNKTTGKINMSASFAKKRNQRCMA